MEEPVLVTIRCVTYNHKPFIRQCLDGFVMQKTNFRFEAVVHDDASTDGTSDVVREYAEKYPEIIIPIIEQENQYHHWENIVKAINEKTRGKYIAICEGDDYWIDPLKLQRQVDFMEEHLDYGMVYTNYGIVGRKLHLGKLKNNTNGVLFPSILTQRIDIATATVLYRLDLYNKLPKHFLENDWRMGDLPLWIEIAMFSKIKHLDIESAMYRVLNESESHSHNIDKLISFYNEALLIKKYYAQKYNVYVDDKIWDEDLTTQKMRYACRLSDKSNARLFFAEGKKNKTLSFRGYIFYLCTMIPLLKKILVKFSSL